MAPIVDGSVSGILPDRRVFAVQYAGYPSSLERAVETLGGEAAISKVRADAGYLQLRFRPEDPYSHPAFGEPHRTSDLLLRISTPKHTEGASSQSGEQNVEAEIVAQVRDSYVFEGMADYQYILALHSNGTKEKKNKESKQCFEKGGLMDMGQEDLMILVPPLFATKDMPEETLLRPSDRSKSKPADNLQVDFQPCFGLDFKARDVPKALNWEDKLVKDSEEWCLHRAMVKCFEERPIWVRTTLVQRLHEQNLEPTPSMLKRLLFRLSYNFLYGPFRTLWIRNGYDPRNDPDSRKYQMLDFRVPRSLRYSVRSPASRKPADYTYWKDECTFKVVPQKKFSYFQLYDLDDDFIRSQIEKPAERATCSESTGWFRRGTLERMRQQVRLNFLSLIPGDAARALEETELKNFERFKNRSGWRGGSRGSHKSAEPTDKMDIDDPSDTAGDANLNSQESAQDDTNVKHPEGLNGDDEDEDDEEEEDDEVGPEEDEDEDEDEYEDDEDRQTDKTKDQDKNDTSAAQPTSTDPSHEIPRNCLQALLGKFPLGSSGSQKSGEADDDGEYAIYEQEDEEDDD